MAHYPIFEGFCDQCRRPYFSKKKSRCPYCTNRIPKSNIVKDAPWMTNFLQDKSIAHLIAPNAAYLLKPICPICCREHTNYISYNKLYTRQGFCCNYCGKAKSAPEKIVANILNFLNLRFIPQFSKKNALWCGTYKYDFYVEHNDKKIIIETHGLQHYDERSMYFIRKDGTNQKEIDIIKRKLAKDNIDNYIEIDCSSGEKSSILNTIIDDLDFLIEGVHLDTPNILNTAESLFFDVCKTRNETGKSVDELSSMYGIDRSTILHYLNAGTKLGFCLYDSKEERKRLRGRAVKVTLCGVSLGEYPTITDAAAFMSKFLGESIDRKTLRNLINRNYNYKDFYCFFI